MKWLDEDLYLSSWSERRPKARRVLHALNVVLVCLSLLAIVLLLASAAINLIKGA